MIRHLYLAVTLGLVLIPIPLRAANRLRAGMGDQTKIVWTNDDLEKLRTLGMISIVGRMEEATPASASTPDVKTQDPDWYAAQAAKLRDQFDRRQAQLDEYRRAIDDTRTLRETSGGINLIEGNIGITPQCGTEILQQRINETQAKLDALEDLARRDGISPGALRVE